MNLMKREKSVGRNEADDNWRPILIWKLTFPTTCGMLSIKNYIAIAFKYFAVSTKNTHNVCRQVTNTLLLFCHAYKNGWLFVVSCSIKVYTIRAWYLEVAAYCSPQRPVKFCYNFELNIIKIIFELFWIWIKMHSQSWLFIQISNFLVIKRYWSLNLMYKRTLVWIKN